MSISISEHFTYGKLFRFTLPTIAMTIFTSVYGIVDGYFVSNYAGKMAFSAVNFTIPFLIVLGSVGFMIGTGGSAIVAKKMGEGKPEKANKIFSMLIYAAIVSGSVLAVFAYIAMPRLLRTLGVSGKMFELSLLYGRISAFSIPVFILQYAFQSFMVAAGKPKLGFAVTLASGLMNMVMDAVFVGVFRWGVAGAAGATVLSECVGGLVPLIYFARPNSSLLRLVKTKFDGKALLKACGNGSSELMSNVAMSMVSMLYNAQLLKYIGVDGVSAYGVLMYVSMVFAAIFLGYSVGTAPIVSYSCGADNTAELKSLFKKSCLIICSFSVLMVLASELLARPLSILFVGYDSGLLELTVRAFRIYSVGYLFSSIAIYGSSFFTALNNGFISAVISFLRTLVFQVAAVLVFPVIWGVDGLWLSTAAAELVAAILTVAFLLAKRKKYGY